MEPSDCQIAEVGNLEVGEGANGSEGIGGGEADDEGSGCAAGTKTIDAVFEDDAVRR